MKKLVYLALFTVSISITSCKECTTCKIVTADYTTVEEEFCGTAAEVSDFEQSYEDQAAEITATGARAECHRK